MNEEVKEKHWKYEYFTFFYLLLNT